MGHTLRNVSLLKKGSHLKKWITGKILNGSHLKKRVTLEKDGSYLLNAGHTWKRGSHLGKKVTQKSLGHTWKNGPHLEK